MQNNIPTAQLRSWLLVAAVPAILSIVGRNGWLTVLLMTISCGALCFCVLSCRIQRFPKWLCILELAWLTVFLGGVARISGSCWEESVSIPIILLLLAAFGSQKGLYQSARMGATLLWLVIPVLGLVFLTGASDINIKWIPTKLELPDGALMALLLLPCASIFLPKEQKVLRGTSLILGTAAIGGSLLMYGTMGSAVARTAPNSFFEFSKGVTLFGVAERFESLVACALTGGVFALLVFILSAIYHLSEKIFPMAAKWSVWLCSIAAAGIMCILPNDHFWMAVGGVIFWGFLPIVAQGIEGRKNIEKK
jgi:hypothetical protein